VGNKVAIIQEYTSSANRRHVPSQSNSANLIMQGIEPATLSSSALWWKGPQWQLHEPSTRPNLEISTSTDNLEVRNVHVQDVTQTFSMLSNSSLVEGNLILYTMTMVPISRVHPTNSMKYTTCFSLSHKWKRYRTS
jgi:hypothetical protein